MTTARASLTACFITAALLAACTLPAAQTNDITFWTTSRQMVPGWGLYPNASEYGTKPLDSDGAAWGSGALTWVADFPSNGSYHVWARHYGGYGGVRVQIDEAPLVNAKGGPRGAACYVWSHLGSLPVTAGAHHVDVWVGNTMFDALLLTTSSNLNPESAAGRPLPSTNIVIRAQRRYRADTQLAASAGPSGLVVSEAAPYAEQLNDWVPQATSIVARLSLWGCANQYVSGAFNARTLAPADKVTVTLGKLKGPKGAVIREEDIDLKVVALWKRQLCLFENTINFGLAPDLMLRDDTTGLPPRGRQGGFGGGLCATRLPAHESRQFRLTVFCRPGLPPGVYKGEVALRTAAGTSRLPVALEVLALNLRAVEGYYSIYHLAQPILTNVYGYVTATRYVAELKDQVRHGLNTTTLYAGTDQMKYAREAGMTEPPCLMGWPDSLATNQIQQARDLGFPDLYYYGIDEPAGEKISRCRSEAERRLKLGQHMMTALNSHGAYAAVWNVVDRPVYNIYVFGGRGAMKDVLAKGFKPISYWVTAISYPLYYRVLSGLYNTACGYIGTAPWAYADGTDFTNAYAQGCAGGHYVAFPDEKGEPITTLRWEEFREGVDDVRYLQALDRAIAAAEARLQKSAPPTGLAEALARGREVRKQHFESIGGRYLDYLKAMPPDGSRLIVARRAMANASVAIEVALVP